MNARSIDRYNEEVGRIYAGDPTFFMLSPAFCRCEAPPTIYSQWAAGQDEVLPARLTSFLLFGGKVLRDLLLSWRAGRARWDDRNGRGVFVFSYFDERNSEGGALREDYFRDVLEGERDVVCFYKLIRPGLYRRGARHLRLLSSLNKTFSAYPEHAFITPGMVAKALWLALRHWARFSSMRLEGENAIVRLLRSAHRRELRDGTVYSGYLYMLFAEAVLARRPRLVLYVWENSCWERILEHIKKRVCPAAVSKGFQHTGFSKKQLQHFPSPHEGALDSYPDVLLCSGEVNRDELKRNPAIPSRVVVGGALRQDRLLRRGVKRPADLVAGSPFPLAFAFPSDDSVYDRILADLELLPPEVEVHLKFHPLLALRMRGRSMPARFVDSRASWAELGSVCRLVLAADNSLMFEGYYHGMHTAVYDGADPMGLERRDFDSPLVHLAKEDLPAILGAGVVARVNASTRRMIEGGYLNRYFTRLDAARAKKLILETP